MKNYLLKGLCIFSVGWLLLSSYPVAAYLPFTTDDAGTNAKGSFQVEQYFYTLLLVGQGSTDTGSVSSGEDYQGVGNARAFPFAISRGLTDNIDLQFTPTYYLQPLGSFSRVANYTLNLKWRFMGDGETGLNLALRPQLIAPSSTAQQEYGIGNAAWNYGLTFIASQFGENYELHFNAGYLRAPYHGAYTVGLSEDANRSRSATDPHALLDHAIDNRRAPRLNHEIRPALNA